MGSSRSRRSVDLGPVRSKPPLGQKSNLSSGLFLSHATMSFRDLIEMKDPAYVDVQRACRDLLDKFVERRPHEILRAAVVGREAYRGRDHVHLTEVIDRPFVSDDTGHADDTSLLCALKRIQQRRCTDQFKNLI